MSGKALMLSMSRNNAATSSTPRRNGSTICRVSRHAPAPSIRAASTSSCGSICSPARIINIVNGNHSQTSATMIAGSAYAGCVISAGIGQPSAASAQCAGLMSGVYRTFQMMATTIGGSTIGIRKTVRSASRNRERRFSSRANPNPSSICSPTVHSESWSWTHSDPRRRASASSRW